MSPKSPSSSPSAYRQAGVDIEAGDAFASSIQSEVARTLPHGIGNRLIGGIGGFAGGFDLATTDIKDPILLAATDGVGTKLEVTRESGRLQDYRHLGIDLVAMSVNDVLVAGGKPLFFLDYIATAAINPKHLKAIVAGVADGCILAGAQLIGGETAEMPDVYGKDKNGDGFDLAGFCVGVAERDTLLSTTKPQAGDIAIALASHGVHANGFSLVRKILADQNLTGDALHAPAPFAKTKTTTLADALLMPTAIYVDAVLPLVRHRLITSAAHITGGGLVTNPPRVFADNLCLRLDMTSWQLPSLFAWMQNVIGLADEELLEVFNCGVGMVVTTPEDKADQVLTSITETSKHKAWVIGRLAKRETKTSPPVTFDNLSDWQRESLGG